MSRFSRGLFPPSSRHARRVSDTHDDGSHSPETPASRHKRASSTGTEESGESRRSSSAMLSSTLSFRSRNPSPGALRSNDPQGLTIVSRPDSHLADIIFIHGLGGSSRLTWCKDKKLENFWPETWLPFDVDLQHARILTFGYSADFRSSAQSASLSISDFAKNLLYDMLYFRDETNDASRLGQVPIIFVVHSMGGLVFKKAYLDGQLESRFETIMNSIRGVIFLSTPHRGSNLADILNRLLSSFISAPKQYVADLAKQAPFLRTINEQFRHVAPRLQIFSFYETLQTSLGFTSAMILEEESAKLGYPGEVSRSLNADHHDVCKFSSPDDVGYRAVLGALKSLMSTDEKQAIEMEDLSPETDLPKLREILSISAPIDQDHSLSLSRRAEGTCEWVMADPDINNWISSETSAVFCIHGRPGRGKSVMASYFAQLLQEEGYTVQLFVFKYGDDTRQSVAALLRHLAYQIAELHPGFGRAILRLAESGHRLRDAEWRTTWRRLFSTLLFKMDDCPPLYWVVDGLDESSAPHHVLELLTDIAGSVVPIHVLLTSRWTPALASGLERLNTKVRTSILSIDQDKGDLEVYVRNELEYLGWSLEIKDDIVDAIKSQANDNFLWTHLVVEEIKECHTEEDVIECLNEIPPGMDALYARMEQAVLSIKRPGDLRLSRTIFIWALYGKRSLTLVELMAILQPEFGRVLNISSTIHRLCGHFIVTDPAKPLQLIHQTARDYLTGTHSLPFSLDSTSAHEEIFEKSMRALIDSDSNSTSKNASLPVGHEYYVSSWPHHLESSKNGEPTDQKLDLLLKFFKQSSILTWISSLASRKLLRVLADASRAVHSFVKRKRRADAVREPRFQRFEDLELLELWSRDLLKILGKFGHHLAQQPNCIYNAVAPFCPKSSAMYKTFGTSLKGLTVYGSSGDWDDCLVRLSVGGHRPAAILCCSARYVSAIDATGVMILWDNMVFSESRRLVHGAAVHAACFSMMGDRIATCGTRVTKVWSAQTGDLLRTLTNPKRTKALCLEFSTDGEILIMGTDRRKVFTVSLTDDTSSWESRPPIALDDAGSFEGSYLNAPSMLSLSPDRNMIVAAYRGFPCTIWTLDPPKFLQRVSRNRPIGTASSALPFVSSLCWHPDSNELMGIFLDGHIFRLNTSSGAYTERAPESGQVPSSIACSPDGQVFAVVGVHGSVKLYDYHTFTCLYHLRSDDTITSLIFSHDGGQFYDIRGPCCTVWEPAALVRLLAASGEDEPAPSHSHDEHSSSSTSTSEAAAHTGVPLTVIAIRPDGGSMVAVCDQEGNISVCDPVAGLNLRIEQTATTFSVNQLVWDRSGSRFCYSEPSGRLTVIAIEPDPASSRGDLAQLLVARFRPELESYRITQLEFLWPSGHLLLTTSEIPQTQIWDVDSDPPKLVASCKLSSTVKWMALPPPSKNLLIAIDGGRLTAYNGETLEIVSDLGFKELPYGGSAAVPGVTSVYEDSMALITHHGGFAIVSNVAQDSLHGAKLHFTIINISPLAASNPPWTQYTLELTTFVPLPEHILNDITRPLNILRNGLLIYVNKNLEVSSWPISAAYGEHSEATSHFIIPRDWLPSQDLGLLHVTETGTVLCPRKGLITGIETLMGDG